MKYILTITGPSGAGKDTLLDAILVNNGAVQRDTVSGLSASCYVPNTHTVKISELVSHTTRAPRAGEVDGVAYHFVDFPTFKAIDKVEETCYAGKYYCLASDELRNLKDGSWGAVIVDQEGARCVRDYVNQHSDEFKVMSVFLHISSYISKIRMENRGDSADSIAKRLKQQAERKEYFPNNKELFDFILPSQEVADLHYNVILIQNAMEKYLRSNA